MARPIPVDPTELIESLDPDCIREQLAELGRREAALRVLLRSVLARDRHRQRRQQQEVSGDRR